MSDIKAKRIKSGMTQTQASELIGVHPRTWQRWESGESRMPRSAQMLFDRIVNERGE